VKASREIGFFLAFLVVTSLPTYGQANPQPGWKVVRSTYAMDDTPILAYSVRSEGPAATSSTLMIRCKQAKLEIYVTALDVKGSEAVNVRLDKRPYRTEFWDYSTDHRALFSKSPKLLLKEILRSQRMLVEYQPFVESPAILTFSIPPFDKHLPELAKVCELEEQFQQELGSIRWYRVTEVLAGDLLKLDDDSLIQLQCVSGPTKVHPMHFAAREVVKALVKDKRVRLEYDENFKVLRNAWLAYVFLEDGIELNAELVQMGFASVHGDYGCSRSADFYPLYEEARAEGRGLWRKASSSNPKR
jgi:endonuclease YncB( thermonuclease family)